MKVEVEVSRGKASRSRRVSHQFSLVPSVHYQTIKPRGVSDLRTTQQYLVGSQWHLLWDTHTGGQI